MHAFRTLTVWTCLLIVALPLSPCAFFSSSCCNHETALVNSSPATNPTATDEACDQPGQSCCAHHDNKSLRSAPLPGDRPCMAECCLLSPFVPQLAKVVFDAHPLAVALVLPQPVAIAMSPFEAASLPLAADPPLQILHCQWRL
jgi:hypothetical protein